MSTDDKVSLEDDLVGRAIQLAGQRPAVPDDLKEAARAAWRAKVEATTEKKRRRHRGPRSGSWLAAAAVLLLAVGLAFLTARRGPAEVATVEALFTADALPAIGPDGVETSLRAGDTVIAGATLETGAETRAALRLAGGASVRLDGGTLLELEGASLLVLHRGGVYLDSGTTSPQGDTALSVKTPFGIATDIGTQFEVRLLEDGLRVQVREGEVRLDLDDRSDLDDRVFAAGTTVTVRADGTHQQDTVPRHGPAWDWVLRAAPSFDVEGRSVREFLEWTARETGWQVRYADPELEREAAAIVVHGAITGLTPEDAPHVVLPGSGLAFRVIDGTLLVDRAP